MKRDPRLHGLSGEHHHALVLARRIEWAVADDGGSRDPELLRSVKRELDGELGAHFDFEEAVLLPALRAAGEEDLAARTEREHREMRALVARGDLAGFAALLRAHVRFEEHVLFPACEARLPAEVLADVARRTGT